MTSDTQEPATPEPAPESVKTASQLEVEQLRREAEEYKDKYFRTLAELENSRKRMAKDKQDGVKHAVMDVLAELLKPIDQFDSALKFAEAATADVQNWAVGFKMILTHFRDVLSMHGVTSFDSEGEMFDPHLHEAVEIVETDSKPEGTIVQELTKGYKMGDKTLRPARVKVVALPKSKSSTNPEGV